MAGDVARLVLCDAGEAARLRSALADRLATLADSGDADGADAMDVAAATSFLDWAGEAPLDVPFDDSNALRAVEIAAGDEGADWVRRG